MRAVDTLGALHLEACSSVQQEIFVADSQASHPQAAVQSSQGRGSWIDPDDDNLPCAGDANPNPLWDLTLRAKAPNESMTVTHCDHSFFIRNHGLSHHSSFTSVLMYIMV